MSRVGKEHHIFHLHSHQWLFTPDDDNSTYLDSQAIGPGSGYTYEIAYNGSGNRNKTPGDAIFHCHFYPHFAQGMWALWRSHDVFERGTELDANGVPVAGTRALPDGGTPIPALVPIPTLPMAPMPEVPVQIVPGPVHTVTIGNTTVTAPAGGQVKVLGDGNPGYPFFIPGMGGHRPPTPVLDMTDPANPATSMDGGLPRHIITGGTASHVETPLDFSKQLVSVSAEFLAEQGTTVEKAAMAYHGVRFHSTVKPDGSPAQYELNGLPGVPGAPFADPCRTDTGQAIQTNRLYKGAGIQLDMKLNKEGWHFPQARLLTLWDDVAPTLAGTRPPEPFVMRVNSGDCINYYHSNLLPNVYEQDAYQVRTPTDIIGQHIHLVKFDVTSSDGSGNGFNYEDGTLSPDEVRERINAIRAGGACTGTVTNCSTLAAKPHPFFGAGPNGAYLGARTTIQRWYADPLVSNAGLDRTLGTVFTHDHFGPSSHQQTGLYATLLVEPRGSQWRNPETGVLFGTKQNSDGGPTSWHADILTTTNPAIAAGNFDKDSHREFFFEFADFQHAYEAGHGVDAGKPSPDAAFSIAPSGLNEVGLPDILAKPVTCPNGDPFVPKGCPQAISAEDVGTFSVNYRNEPLALRVRDPVTNTQAAGQAGDLSWAFSSRVKRADPKLNVQPTFYPPLTPDMGPQDPFTPMMRVYQNDKVRVRIQVGATEEGHNASIHALKWLQEYASPNSGWRNSQMLGISEQFILDMPVVTNPGLTSGAEDYLYMLGASTDDLWNGNWGVLRSYTGQRPDLLPLPNNPIGAKGLSVTNMGQFRDTCPTSAPVRKFNVTAVTAKNALPGGTLVYNSRTANNGPLHDPTAILYVRSEDLDGTGKLLAGKPIEPLILRANAGDCIQVNLVNKLPNTPPDLDGFNHLPPIVVGFKADDGFNANDVHPSSSVGLHPQLLAYDVSDSDGANVGQNQFTQTVGPNSAPAQPGQAQFTYQWYAGDLKLVNHQLVATPVEFGAVNLMPSDRIKQGGKGAIGALIIEPQGSTWVEDPASRASATVTKADGTTFRDFALLFQDDLNLRLGNGTTIGDGRPVPTVAGEEDSEDSGTKGLNYRTEPLWFRLGIDPAATPAGHAGGPRAIDTYDFTNALSNSLVGGDPQAPVFTAKAGAAVRLRVLQPAGHARNHTIVLHGHTWGREPYVSNSSQIGDNPLSEWHGSQEGHGPTDHWDIVPVHGAGGAFRVTGDYLIRDFAPLNFYGGLWAILSVQ